MHLISDLGNLRTRETFWFLTKRDIPLTVSVKAHHPVEPCPREEKKIQRIMCSVKAIPNTKYY